MKKVILFAMALILSSCAGSNAKGGRSTLERLTVGDDEYDARNEGCLMTFKMQHQSYLLHGDYGEKILRGAAIENCNCSNGKCRKANQ